MSYADQSDLATLTLFLDLKSRFIMVTAKTELVGINIGRARLRAGHGRRQLQRAGQTTTCTSRGPEASWQSILSKQGLP